MANPSDEGARGPAGPIAEPFRTTPRGPAPSGVPSSGTARETPSPESAAGGSSRGVGAGQSPGFGSGQPGSETAPDRPSNTLDRDASLSDGLKETAQMAADAVRQQAARFAGDVGHELSRTGEAQKMRGVEAMRSFARAIDSAADEFKPQSPMVARTVHEAARSVEGLSDNLSNRNVNELIESAAQLARAQPALFIGGSVAAGFALARFLKSSARGSPRAPTYDPSQR
jgi:hypothetical protein